MSCLLVANFFTPIRGGSAVVYQALCDCSPPGSMVVLAPWRMFSDSSEIPGWREHDAAAKYPIYRMELLRPLDAAAPSSILISAWRWLSIDLPLMARVFLSVREIVKRHGVKVICIGELVTSSWIGLLGQRLLGCKMISYIHGEEITTEMGYRFYGRQRRRYLRKADAVVAVSHFTERALVRLMGVAPQKIHLFHNGVDVERFKPGPKRADLIERHGLAGKRIILTVGRIVPRKGFDAVIRAMPTILASVPDAHYLVVGGGHFRPTLEALVAGHGMEEHVTFAGMVADEDLADYYRLCDLFVMANREMPDGDTEGFGLVFLEANACGKPVVGGIAGGAVEAVRHGENGLLVDSWSVEAIAETITRLLNDGELYQRIARRGLEIALASSSRAKAEQFQALCDRLIEGRAS
jgi:phosphatidylinositol alpha-1,6-mannosyltransferase